MVRRRWKICRPLMTSLLRSSRCRSSLCFSKCHHIAHATVCASSTCVGSVGPGEADRNYCQGLGCYRKGGYPNAGEEEAFRHQAEEVEEIRYRGLYSLQSFPSIARDLLTDRWSVGFAREIGSRACSQELRRRDRAAESRDRGK